MPHPHIVLINLRNVNLQSNCNFKCYCCIYFANLRGKISDKISRKKRKKSIDNVLATWYNNIAAENYNKRSEVAKLLWRFYIMELNEAIKKYAEMEKDSWLTGTYYGIRITDKRLEIGDECECSHELYQDPTFDEDGELVYPYIEDIGLYDAGELDGTCSISIHSRRAVELANRYLGEHMYIIAGNAAEEGNDPDEIIISDAKVVEIIK